jgi:hypothetical protein
MRLPKDGRSRLADSFLSGCEDLNCRFPTVLSHSNHRYRIFIGDTPMDMSPVGPIHPQLMAVVWTAWPTARELPTQLTSTIFQKRSELLLFAPRPLLSSFAIYNPTTHCCDHHVKMRCLPFPSLQKYMHVSISESFLSRRHIL